MEVLDQNRRDMLAEDGDHLSGVGDRRLPAQVCRRPRQGPLPATPKLAHELTERRVRRLLGPDIQDRPRLYDMSWRTWHRCGENHAERVQPALERLHPRDRIVLAQRSRLQVDVLAEKLWRADEGVTPPRLKADVVGRVLSYGLVARGGLGLDRTDGCWKGRLLGRHPGAVRRGSDDLP